MKPAFDLKSARLRLEALTVRLHNADRNAIAATLSEKPEQYTKFAAMPLILDISRLHGSEDLDIAAVAAAFAGRGLRIVALRHDHSDWSDAAKQAGLMWLSGERHHAAADAAPPETKSESDSESESAAPESDTAEPPAAEPQPESEPAAEIKSATESESATGSETESAAESADTEEAGVQAAENGETAESATEPPPEPAAPEFSAHPTMVITTPVRTGQQIYAKQADLVVLGIVSEGAELIADGNIHVYAPMRGRALAGHSGDTKARIFIQHMQAELVSVAGVYRVFEQNLPPHLHKHAVQISLQDESKLVIAAIGTQSFQAA